MLRIYPDVRGFLDGAFVLVEEIEVKSVTLLEITTTVDTDS